MPIEYRTSRRSYKRRRKNLRDVGEGGVCFSTDDKMPEGGKIHLIIRVKGNELEVDGVVTWCKHRKGGFDIGVSFNDSATDYAVRMVEQVCHIEQYRAKVKEEEGRELTSQEAAEEWIERYAARFPQ